MVRKVTVPFWRLFLLVGVQVLQDKTMNKILFHLASSQLCIMTSGLFNVTYPWWYWYAFLLSTALSLRSFLKPSTRCIATLQMPFLIFSFQVLEAASLPK